MKERARLDPGLLWTIKSSSQLHNIWMALDGDPRWLANSLRSGFACKAEMVMAADLIEGKIRPPRAGSSDLNKRFEIADTVATMAELCPKVQRKVIISEVAEMYGVSERFVYNALAEFDEHYLSEIKRIQNEKYQRRLPIEILEALEARIFPQK
jgi:hypothetical protein